MRRHILHRTVSVFLLICLLLSFTACTKLRAKRLEFTPYYSEHIASAYEQTSPTLLMSEPVPKDFDMDSAQLILCNYINPKKNTLHPYECKVYLWK